MRVGRELIDDLRDELANEQHIFHVDAAVAVDVRGKLIDQHVKTRNEFADKQHVFHVDAVVIIDVAVCDGADLHCQRRERRRQQQGHD